MKNKTKIYLGSALLMLLTITGCDNSSNNRVEEPPVVVTPPPPPAVADASFSVQITNMTNAQPLSPVAIILHSQGYTAFTDGQPASLAIEQLAEGGSNADLLGDAQAASQHLVSGSTTGPVPPRSISDDVVLTLPSDQISDLRLSVASMLVHTNDAFTAINAADITSIEVGETREFFTPTWDSGTEANDELSTTMPGPDFGGEGFNSARNDLFDRVHFHQGAVSNASVEFGLPSSNLEERHRFDNQTAKVIITRIE